jgi:hypothetical protein
VEFANGRGRLDVTAVRQLPPVALNGVTVAAPLAKPGDYYLFDNTGFILVRPATRTFSSFVFTRAELNHTGALLPGAFMFYPTGIDSDTLLASDSKRLKQHVPVSIHWHMQRPNSRELYARGWLELPDVPAIEAGAARWFEVAAALATRPGGVSTLAPGGLEVTSVVLLHRRDVHTSEVVYLEMLTPLDVTAVGVDPVRLVLPTGYEETPWPRFVQAPGLRAPLSKAGVKWQTLDDSSAQRRHATCRAPWLSELRSGTQ